jgi:hypothetical protein
MRKMMKKRLKGRKEALKDREGAPKCPTEIRIDEFFWPWLRWNQEIKKKQKRRKRRKRMKRKKWKKRKKRRKKRRRKRKRRVTKLQRSENDDQRKIEESTKTQNVRVWIEWTPMSELAFDSDS